MENRYVYVCNKCKQVYFSERKVANNCQECNFELVQMPIYEEEWHKLTDDEKTKFKEAFLSNKEAFKYSSKATAPLAWHKFTRYFRAPMSLLNYLSNYGRNNLTFNIFTISSIAFTTLFFIGSFSWKKYAWWSIVLSDLLAIVIAIFAWIINPLNYDGLILCVLATVLAGLEINYYVKRKQLFDGKKEGNSETRVEEINREISNSINNSNKQKTITEEDLIKNEEKQVEQIVEKNSEGNKIIEAEANKTNTDEILYCKLCGVKLYEDEVYCHKCGSKIERE